MKKLLRAAIAGLAGFLLPPAMSIGAQAQTAALTGQVSSLDEGLMEGVLVSAKKDGSTMTTTVVTNEQGRYSFPAAKLEPGRYAISIRAVGYNLVGPRTVDIPAGAAATADLKLGKTRNLAAQLSNAEWLISLPGTDKEKAFLTNCTGCHTLQRNFVATHNADEWQQVFIRMGRYAPGSMTTKPQVLPPGPRAERPRVDREQAKAAAEYLVSVSRSNPEAEEYELKTLPRPKGRATRVIITEYDLPRKDAQPHDVVVDADGTAWYSDFGDQFIGELDPKTGKVTDYPLPLLKKEAPKGSLELQLDPDGNLWAAMMYQAGIAKLDRKTKTVQAFEFPKEWQSGSTQASMVSPTYSNVDGKVWVNNQENHSTYRFDIATGRFENLGQSKDASGKQIRAYGMPTDKHNNMYMLEFSGQSIGRRDAKTGEVSIWPTPTAGSRPRRGRVDEQNRLWFAEYGANRIGMFDPKTQTITEWRTPTPWDSPYDVAPSKNGEVWTGSMQSDLVTRLDPKTGEMVQYLLPKISVNIRRVFIEDSGSRPVFWTGSNHGASIFKVEPLD